MGLAALMFFCNPVFAQGTAPTAGCEKEFNEGMRYTQLNQPDKARTEFEKCLTLLSSSDSHLPLVYFNIGQTYFVNKSFNKAIENFKKAIALDPSPWYFYMHLGKAYSLNNEPLPAVSSFLQSLKLKPMNLTVHYELYKLYDTLAKQSGYFKELVFRELYHLGKVNELEPGYFDKNLQFIIPNLEHLISMAERMTGSVPHAEQLIVVDSLESANKLLLQKAQGEPLLTLPPDGISQEEKNRYFQKAKEYVSKNKSANFPTQQ